MSSTPRRGPPLFDPEAELRGPVREPGTLAVRPKPAATLILLDRREGGLRVLMGRRHGRHDFMPDKWVFPGGRVDPADSRDPVLSPLTPPVAEPLARAFPRRPALPRALGVAAVRETWEEAGLALGALREGGASPQADLAALELIARAVTPPYRGKRFDTVFFAADADRLASRERAGGSGELAELAWFTLEETGRLDLPAITRVVLGQLAERLADPGRPPQCMTFRHGKHRQAGM